MSDDQSEYQLKDRLSFMRFVGLALHDPVPDAKNDLAVPRFIHDGDDAVSWPNVNDFLNRQTGCGGEAKSQKRHWLNNWSPTILILSKLSRW